VSGIFLPESFSVMPHSMRHPAFTPNSELLTPNYPGCAARFRTPVFNNGPPLGREGGCRGERVKQKSSTTNDTKNTNKKIVMLASESGFLSEL
jgi:hypothetical protein